MARYQLRRPTPIQVLATRAKRQEAGLGAVGPGSAAEGPESPNSPGSSPSTTGAPSPADDSESEDGEPPSPKESSSRALTQPISTLASTATSSTLLVSTKSSQATSTAPSSQLPSSSLSQTSSSTSTSISLPAFTQASTSQGIGAVAPPPVTDSPTTTSAATATSTRTTSTAVIGSTTSTTTTPSPTSATSVPSSASQIFSSKIARPTLPVTISPSVSSATPPARSGLPFGEGDPPRRTRPEPTLMSKGAEAAAITLSILGAIALVVCILFYCKRRRRRRNEKLEAELERDAANHAARQAPETAHISNVIAPFASSGPHMTQSSNRSDTLFGPGAYFRPETVSTRNGSNISQAQPTPNPFADPPLNKAYDVLAGRPRSTTLTDRGSWIKNPFKDPESERFDPFGELQAKARRERVKQVELARREAELERQFDAKQKMGLMPPELEMNRKGSGVTLEGMGVLDRSNGGAY